MKENNKTSLNIKFETDNNYFSTGVLHLISELFHDEFKHHFNINIVSESTSADLIFSIRSPGEKAFDWVDCHYFKNSNDYKFEQLRTKRITIYNHKQYQKNTIKCPVENGILSLQDPIIIMRQKLQKIIFDGEQHGPPDFQNINCGKCIGEHNLSIKEKIISGYLYKGFCTTEIANKMRVSSKLICNYRRAIKQKLDIRNHSDFILWLKTRTVSENYSYLTDCDEDQKKNNSDYSSLC